MSFAGRQKKWGIAIMQWFICWLLHFCNGAPLCKVLPLATLLRQQGVGMSNAHINQWLTPMCAISHVGLACGFARFRPKSALWLLEGRSHLNEKNHTMASKFKAWGRGWGAGLRLAACEVLLFPPLLSSRKEVL